MVDDANDETWPWLDRVAAGATRVDAVSDLARDIVKRSGAERVFVAFVCDERWEAIGVDIDGLSIAHCESRLDRHFVEDVLRASGPVYRPETQGAGGRGSRLAIAGPETSPGARRTVVLLEHRFVSHRFDALDETCIRRWVTLASLADRLISGENAAGAAAELTASSEHAEMEELSASSTSVPVAVVGLEFPSLVGTSPPFRGALTRLQQCLESELPVLITGETGVGKELFARALHDHGPRRTRPFIALNCGAVPENLFEAEIFGHERGAFTGADRARPGLIAKADGGTLFLDEIGELPPARQAALLRAIESRRYRPVGGDAERHFDVRLVTATNRDLDQAIRARAFRSDLYYRINVLRIVIPPLRKRKEDIPRLVQYFLSNAGSCAELSMSALSALEAYDWPGNVRELEHQVLRLTSTSLKRIEARHLPRHIRAALQKRHPARSGLRSGSEREQAERALAEAGGNITHAAKILGLTRHGLKKRLLRLGMREPSIRRGKGSRP